MRQRRIPAKSSDSGLRWLTVKNLGLAISLLVFFSTAEKTVRGDEFDRLEGRPFFEIPSRSDVRTHTSLSFSQLDALPTVLRGERDALVIVRTDQGNLAKLLISHGLQRQNPTDLQDPGVPVLILERFMTLDASDHRSFKARGRSVTLFEGFSFDLDSGQIVPEGFGGDIRLARKQPEGPQLAAIGTSRLFTLEQPWPTSAKSPGRPSSGKSIQPADFAGRYYLIANGQWTGRLELAVDDAQTVSGTFRSDRVGTAYPVSGKFTADAPEKISFSVRFPRGTEQLYDGILWTEHKNVMAGTFSMLARSYSFIAIRDGSPLLPEDLDFRSTEKFFGRASRRVVRVDAGSKNVTLDGQSTTSAGLTDLLKNASPTSGARSLLIRADGTVPFDRLGEVVASVRAAGITTIELAPADGKGDPP
jgi:hypothetical protein